MPYFRLFVLLQIPLLFYAIAVSSLNVNEVFDKNCTAILNISSSHFRKHSQLQSSHKLVVQCPPWFHWNRENAVCQAGPQLDGIVLSKSKTHQTSILECNCMTADEDTLSVGACLYTCNAISGYYPLPCHVSDLTNFTCADLNRQGSLCGECRDGYAPPVYSYVPECVKCENYHYNWLKYLAVAFLPLTLFYVIVTLFSISFTSPLLSGVVMFFHLLANPIQMAIVVNLADSGRLYINSTAVKVIASILTVWNLDFFRAIYSPFCLHPKINTLRILALDYLIASYPLLLILLTYILVKLHVRNFRIVVWGWKLFSKLKCSRQPKTSLIDVFASFIFLSSSRLLTASFNFLVPTYKYTIQINTARLTSNKFVLNAPTVEYFGDEHLPFALLALLMVLLFVFLPILLLLIYPFHWFQSLLNKLNLNSHALRTFMDVFQGSFKDGTNGSRDCRFFSAFLLLIGVSFAVIFSLTLTHFYYMLAGTVVLVYCILLIMFQPYKQRRHNYTAITMATALLCAFLSLQVFIQATNIRNSYTLKHWNAEESVVGLFVYISLVLFFISVSLPFLYLLGLVLALVFIKRGDTVIKY